MSVGSPNVIGSILQGTVQQAQAARERDGESSARAEAVRDGTRAAERSQFEVETADGDTRIHPDAGGQGSQGRPFSGERESEQEAEEPDSPGLHTDEDGRASKCR